MVDINKLADRIVAMGLDASLVETKDGIRIQIKNVPVERDPEILEFIHDLINEASESIPDDQESDDLAEPDDSDSPIS